MAAKPKTKRPNVLILGIGNLLWADEGFGVRAVEEMHRRFATPQNVTLMDGGTQGIYLVQHVREADVLIVFDAVDYGLPPGTMKRVEDGEVPQFLGAKKVSLHQTGFQEVIAMAEMLGDAPERLLLIGVQPKELDDYGGSLRDSVRARIDPAIELALTELARLGIDARPRPQPLSPESTIACQVMTPQRYEGERPPADQAFRKGDMRVLVSGGFAPPDDPDAEVEAILGRTQAGAS